MRLVGQLRRHQSCVCDNNLTIFHDFFHVIFISAYTWSSIESRSHGPLVNDIYSRICHPDEGEVGGEGGESGGVDEGKGGEREEGKDEVKEKRGKIWRSFNAAIYPPNPVSKYLNCEKHMTYDMRYSFKVL